MSRSGYVDDVDDVLAIGRWRAAVKSGMRGKRGQAMLREMLAAMDAMTDKRLYRDVLVFDGFRGPYQDPVVVGGDSLVDQRGEVLPVGAACALGTVALARGLSVDDVDPEDHETVADRFGISHAMACEIMYWNDEGNIGPETPEARWTRMRKWVASQIIADAA